jgi:hypothetical protein
MPSCPASEKTEKELIHQIALFDDRIFSTHTSLCSPQTHAEYVFSARPLFEKKSSVSKRIR